MTLQEVVQRVRVSQQLAGTDPAAALGKNRALFLDFIRQDRAYIVPEAEVSEEALEQKLFRPYTAPAQDGDPRLFLRVFSHEELAASFAEQHGQEQVCEIDGIELVQLAKTWFLRGAYGFLLNDGSVWTALSFPDFLVDFYREILGDETLARPEFIALVSFINMVRQNHAYHIQAGRPTLRDAGAPIQTRFVDRPNDIWSAEPGDWLYEECRLEHLMQASGASNDALIYIKTSKCDLKIQPAYLRAALCAAGLADRTAQPGLDFHTDSIALDYRMQDFDLERFPLQCQLAELPKLEEPEPGVEPAEAASPPLWVGLLEKLKKLRPEKKHKEAAPQEEGKEPEKKERKPLQLDPRRMVKGFFAAAFLLILIAVVVQLLKPSALDKLEDALAAGDDAQTVVIYQERVSRDPDSREASLQMLAADLDAALEAYAADAITADQLAGKITAYEDIKAMQAKCGSVYDQASALERSKTAFNEGLVETSMAGRLTAWQGVIEADTGSMEAMQSALVSNADLYKDLMFEEVRGMDRGSALSALLLLQSYYPDDKDVADRIQEWRDETAGGPPAAQPGGPGTGGASEPGWPIMVGDIYVTKAGGSYDLHIPWQNCSGHTIDGLLFTVTALDTAGDPITAVMVDDTGKETTYDQYIADVGTGADLDGDGTGDGFEDGFAMPEDAAWKSAWATSEEISGVRLDSVWLRYEDETIPPWTYTRPAGDQEPGAPENPAPSVSWDDLLGS